MWFIKHSDGIESGPFEESELRRRLPKLSRETKIRQGTSAWKEVDVVRALFAKLAETGWYFRANNRDVDGPFTKPVFTRLLREGKFASGEYRQGQQGPWRALAPQNASQTPPPIGQPPKSWSVKKTKTGAARIHYECPSCKLEGSVPNSAGGTADDCLNCSARIQIPTVSAEDVLKAEISESTIKRKTRPVPPASQLKRSDNIKVAYSNLAEPFYLRAMITAGN